MTTVLAATSWPTNGHMIEAVAGLGFLAREWLTLDLTWGRGTFWKRWRPDRLVTNDLGKNRPDVRCDARCSPFRDGTFKATVVDLPYKLNGRPGKGCETCTGAVVACRERCTVDDGSVGHAYAEPTVRFHGGRDAGWHAYGVAQMRGLPVDSLRRIWPVIDGEPVGPYWELTFKKVDD